MAQESAPVPLLIRPVLPGSPEIAEVRALFEEYWSSFGFTPCFQGFADEVAGLPGKYAPPDGGLALAEADGKPVGCIAFRRLDATRCEMKRLYTRPQARGRGIGPALLDWLIEAARRAGYREIVADTLPVMDRAIALYERYGFEFTGPYTADPTPGAIFLRKPLW